VYGDHWYYPQAREFGPKGEDPRDRVIALHARQLRLKHPFSHEEMTFTAPLPDYWPKVSNLPLVPVAPLSPPPPLPYTEI
jgi:23S rRNA pseudouridine1911/1915/1917 synthase